VDVFAAPAPLRAEGDGWALELVELLPGVWMHTTWRELPTVGLFPASGLLVQDGEGLVMVDTAWGPEPTAQLLGWAEDELGLPVTAALATHGHEDSYAGIPVLLERGITMYFHPRVLPELALPMLSSGSGAGLLEPLWKVDRTTLGALEIFYPGAGHSPGNIVVYLPEAELLFGGCALRAADADGLGNTADADLDSWAVAVARLQAEYPEVKLVVPGHGDPGGPELLVHTAELLAAQVEPRPEPVAVTPAHRSTCDALMPQARRIAAWEPGPPAKLHVGVGAFEVMGGYLEFQPMEAVAAAEVLRVEQSTVEGWLADLGATGASRAQFWVLSGDDGGFHGGMGIPLRHDLAFRHDDGFLVCADPEGASSPSGLQGHLGCAPVAGEDEAWWWCPAGEGG